MARRPKSGVGVLRNYRMRLSHVAPLLLLPLMIPRTNGQLVQYTSEIFSPPWINEPHQAAPVSGLLLPADMAAELKSKSDTLITLYKANNGSVIYLTYNVAFIPTMSRIFEPVPERNLFSNVEGDADFDPVMNKIFAKEPAIILIDMPTGPLAVSKSRKDFQDKVRNAVAKHYRLDRTEGGWQVWTKARS